MLPHQNTQPENSAIAAAQSIVIRREDGEPVTTSMAIAQGTGVQHKNVLELARTHRGSLTSFGEVAFRTYPNATGTPTEVAVLNEPQASLLIAFMRNSAVVVEFKVALVKEFYAMRAELASRAPQTFAAALRLAADLEEQKEILQLQNDQLQTKVAADAPKVEFAETIRALDGVCSIEKIAKTLGIGRNKLFRRMKDDHVLMANNLPYQKYIDREYFTVIEGSPYIDSQEVAHPTFATRVTGAGQVFLARKYAAPALAAA